MQARHRLAAFSAALVLVLTLSVVSAAGSWRAQADSLFSAAEAEYSSGRYENACALYLKTAGLIHANDGVSFASYFASMAARSRFLAARCHERREEWEEAISLYEVSLTELAPISDVVNLRLARCHRENDDLDAAVARLHAIVDGERTSMYGAALEALGDAYTDASDWGNALQWYRMLLTEAGSYNGRAKAHYLMGLTHRRNGDKDAARESFATAVGEYPRSRHSYDALRSGRQISKAFTDRYHQGLVLYNRKRFQEATEFFTYYLKHDREKEFEADATYFLGRSYQRRGKYTSAGRRYEDAIELGDGGEYYDLAWSKRAYCLRATGRVEEGLETYDRYVRLHPDRPAAGEIMWEKARLLEEETRWEEASAAFADLAERYPNHDRARDAQLRSGLCMFKLAEFKRAETAFADLFLGGGGHQEARALFWAGKSRAALGEDDVARERFREAGEAERDSYYGRRSLELLTESTGWDAGADAVAAGHDLRGGNGRISWNAEALDFSTWLAEWYEKVYLPTGREALFRELSEVPEFARADIFLGIHMRDAALREFELLEEGLAPDPRMLDVLVNYYERAGLHKRAIRVSERILAISPATRLSDAPVYLRKRICPAHFDEIVLRECAANGIDPNLYFSLMRQESLFEPAAVSWAGARGLSQIMPATGRGIARKLGVRRFKTADLLTPEVNVRFGTWYLASLIERFDGNIMSALAAYNGGPDNVERWWDYGGGNDTDVFVEDIGYFETRDYVRIVYRYSLIYREIYDLNVQ
jgi:soluble lytic murein transglycosylase